MILRPFAPTPLRGLLAGLFLGLAGCGGNPTIDEEIDADGPMPASSPETIESPIEDVESTDLAPPTEPPSPAEPAPQPTETPEIQPAEPAPLGQDSP